MSSYGAIDHPHFDEIKGVEETESRSDSKPDKDASSAVVLADTFVGLTGIDIEAPTTGEEESMNKSGMSSLIAPEVLRDISYFDDNDYAHTVNHQKSHRRHVLDIYLPAHDANVASLPVLVHVHGGGWQRGAKDIEWRGGPPVGRAMSARGYVVVCMSYRLAAPPFFSLVLRAAILSGLLSLLTWIVRQFVDFYDPPYYYMWGGCFVLLFLYYALFTGNDATTGHPDQAQDIALAISWTRHHLKRYCPKADVESGVFLSGHSAGAHLVALIATDGSHLKGVDIDRQTFLRGVAVVSGIYTMHGPLADGYCHPRNIFFRCMYGSAAVGSTYRWCRGDPPWKMISPIHHVETARDAVYPPFLILNAKSDFGLEVDGRRLCDALREAGAESVEYHVVDDSSHASITRKTVTYHHYRDFMDGIAFAKETTVEHKKLN